MPSKLCLNLMASHGYLPGLLPYHDQHSAPRAWKDSQLIFPIPELKHDVTRSANLNFRASQLDMQWNATTGFPDSSQLRKTESSFTGPVPVDLLGNVPESVLFSVGISKRCAKHEKVMKFLMSGASGGEKDGLDPSLMSDLIEFQVTITDMHRHQAATIGSGCDTRMGMEPSLLYPNKAMDTEECLQKIIDDFLPHPAKSINRDGDVSFVSSVTEMKDMLSVLAEFYIPKGSARWSRQTMLVPQFKWGGAVETPVFINEAPLTLEALRFAPLKSPKKTKPVLVPRRRKATKKAAILRGVHQKNYSHACECFLSLMMDKKRNARTVMDTLKKSGPELPNLLTHFSATIAGTGLAVLFSLACKVAAGRAHFGSSGLLTASLGVGLFWLSWAVNRLRDLIVCIRKGAAKLGSEEEEEAVKKVDKSLNDIFFRAATLGVVAVLRLA